jgi:hypothetical protein
MGRDLPHYLAGMRHDGERLTGVDLAAVGQASSKRTRVGFYVYRDALFVRVPGRARVVLDWHDAQLGLGDLLAGRLRGLQDPSADATLAQALEGMLWPERFPPGHPRHDPEHVYWSGSDYDAGTPFQWSAETIEWVAQAVEDARP